MSKALLCSRVGDKLVKAGKWDEAKALYWSNAKRLVGEQFQIPGLSGSSGGGGLRNAQYTNMGHFEKANLMGCCNGMAKCYIYEKDIESVRGSHGDKTCRSTYDVYTVQALAWLDEVNVLYLNGYYSAEQGPLYGELSMNFTEEEEI